MKTSQIITSIEDDKIHVVESVTSHHRHVLVSVRLMDGRLVLVDFDLSHGFRVLDEGDLLEYWDSGTRSKGWLWEIESGGWLDQRSAQGSFLFRSDATREFMILGIDECVSVVSDREPIVRLSEKGI